MSVFRLNILDFILLTTETRNLKLVKSNEILMGYKYLLGKFKHSGYAHVSKRGVDLMRSSPRGATLTVYPNLPETSQIKSQP